MWSLLPVSKLAMNPKYSNSVPSTLIPLNVTDFPTLSPFTIPTTTSLNFTAICIVSTIQPVINGRYVYNTWDDEDNGPIFYNSIRDGYLYPHI